MNKTLVCDYIPYDMIATWIMAWVLDLTGRQEQVRKWLVVRDAWEAAPARWIFDADTQNLDWKADPLIVKIKGYNTFEFNRSEVGTIHVSSDAQSERSRVLIVLNYLDDEEEVREYFEGLEESIKKNWPGFIKDRRTAEFEDRIARIPPRTALQKPTPPPLESIKKTGDATRAGPRPALPARRRGPKGYPRAQKLAWVQEWLQQQESITQQAFCDLREISPTQLRVWITAYEKGELRPADGSN